MPKPNYKSGALAKYALLVGSAANGAITDPSNFLKWQTIFRKDFQSTNCYLHSLWFSSFHLPVNWWYAWFQLKSAVPHLKHVLLTSYYRHNCLISVPYITVILLNQSSCWFRIDYFLIIFEIFNAALRPIICECMAIFCIPTPIELIQLMREIDQRPDRSIFID